MRGLLKGPEFMCRPGPGLYDRTECGGCRLFVHYSTSDASTRELKGCNRVGDAGVRQNDVGPDAFYPVLAFFSLLLF